MSELEQPQQLGSGGSLGSTEGTPQRCEMPRCHGASIGVYQVYDGDMPTMDRPGRLCQGCFTFAQVCGLRPIASQPGGSPSLSVDPSDQQEAK